MKITYRLDGLECANCASKIEKAINKLDEVESASVNFMTSKLVIQTNSENTDRIKAIVKKYEPDVVVRRI